MPIKKKKISELEEANNLKGFFTIGYRLADGVKESVKYGLEKIQNLYENLVKAKDDATQATEDANAATDRLNNLSDHRDEVRDGYWWHWNEDIGEYENTGELAKGNTLFASFDIDPATGELVCTTDEEYTGASFSVENGDLIVTV